LRTGVNGPTDAPSPRDRIRLHIKNNRSGEDVFRLTEARYRDAADRHSDVADHVDALIDFDLDHFDESIATANALVTWDLPSDIRYALAERAPHLRWVHVIGAGVDHLAPLDWIPAGVTLTNNRGVHVDKAAQYGLMAVLMLNNAIPQLVREQAARRYVECFTTAADDKTLLVIGAGAMGGAVARAARKVGLRTVGVRRRPRPTAGFDEVHAPDALDDLLPAADFVILTIPATPETVGLLDERRLRLMKPEAGLVNMARASIVDYDALATALREGALAGAVLDVFEPEPLPASSDLWTVPNLIITPHMSSDDAALYVPRTLDLVFENLGRLRQGSGLKNRVDPERGY
jgi:glyoxylate/hydroxypyruvate reductase A